MNPPKNSRELAERLGQISASLNLVIAQAIENPLLFAESPTLRSVEELCFSMAAFVPEAGLRKDPEIEKLCWEVRTRAGRLQRLLDSASRFYASCFLKKPCQLIATRDVDSLAYGVHGERAEIATSGYLAFDC